MKKVVAGVDIGGTNTVFGLVDLSGKVLSDGHLTTTDYPVVKDFVKALAAGLRKLLEAKKGAELAGVGIGAPDANFHRGTIEHAPNLAWKGIVPLADLMMKELKVPVVLTNDANAAAMGEMVFGGAKNMNDFIILTIGTGLGSGIVVDGKLVYGHTGFAGEVGHMTVVPGGRECGCGRKGCLETYASASGLVKTVSQMICDMRDESPLRDVPPSKLTSKMIAEAAAKNDPIAVKAMEYTAEKLGFGIVNSIVYTSPEAIFLFGGLAQAGEMLFAPVRKYLAKNNYVLFKNTVKILPSGIAESNGAVLGAGALILNELSLKEA
ncbi:MAG TPA: ROK family protein [Bacteroidales bacterium]|nr:ROK family protein [Bacteroidales bacterium]